MQPTLGDVPVSMLLAFNIALTIIAFLGGWLIKTLFSRLEKLEQADEKLAIAINDLRVTLPTSYVSKEENRSQLDAIHDALRELGRKQDKLIERLSGEK